MGLLFTSDWQASRHNLHLLDHVVDQIVERCQRDNLDVVHCGDVKHAMNPIDGLVLNWILGVCERFRDAGIAFHVIRGNHDSYSTLGSENWLVALEKAGAITYDKPKCVFSKKSGIWIYGLPYCRSIEDTIKGAELLADYFGMDEPPSSVLVFHDEVKGSKYNAKTKAKTSLTANQLKADRYDWVVGGHLHLPHSVGLVAYVGSPFAHDWGEANQRKSFCLIQKSDPGIITRVSIDLPGFYDPSVKGFQKVKPRSWNGHNVRVHSFSSREDAGAASVTAKAKAEQDYPGAIVSVQVHVSGSSADGEVFKDVSDSDSLSSYIAVCPPPEGTTDYEAEALLASALPGGMSAGFSEKTKRILFKECKAHNVLCFEEVSVDFSSTAFTVVTGENLDWKGRRNGVGKTSLVSLPLIALFGRTIKGQTHDSWAREGAERDASVFVELCMVLPDGRAVRVRRARKPRVELRYWVNDQEHSTGTASDTQKALEDLLGFTWDTLVNSVYLDQREVNKIVAGTDTERKRLFWTFLGLDRFLEGQKGLKERLRQADYLEDRCNVAVHSLSGRLEEVTTAITAQVNKARSDAGRLRRELVAGTTKLDSVNREASKYVAQLEQFKKVLIGAESHFRLCKRLVETTQTEIAKADNLLAKRTCFACGQKLPLAGVRKQRKSLDSKLSIAEKEAEQAVAPYKDAEKKYRAVSDRNSRFTEKKRGLKGRIDLLKAQLQEAESESSVEKELRLRQVMLKRDHETAVEAQFAWQDEVAFFKWAVVAFGRKGIPAFLVGRLCPVLNGAMERYAQVFNNGEIQVRFDLEGDQLVPTVMNRSGSGFLLGQSCGELRMVSIAVCFALWEIVSPVNLLVLDEPGEGLDELNASQFAECLLRHIPSLVGSIWLVTHNPSILGPLEAENTIHLVKENKVTEILHERIH